ncbi:MAG: hypothetical protein M3N54_15990 [Acidobacteriota bacterium]|nr:hypothetical protein [Acidobacteriota bacterium]
MRASLWDFHAGTVAESARPAIAAHLSECRECELHGREVTALRSGLKHLPVRQAPAILTTRLLISASRERSRREQRRDFGTWLRERRLRLRLFVDNLVKPFAVPAAGGILTSFLCFGVIVDSLHVSSSSWDNDIPLGMSTEVTIDELSPFTYGERDVMVRLTVDASGNVTDYAVPTANPSPEEMREIGNLVLYSSFTPATRFGQAISSKRLFFIRHISVKG